MEAISKNSEVGSDASSYPADNLSAGGLLLQSTLSKKIAFPEAKSIDDMIAEEMTPATTSLFSKYANKQHSKSCSGIVVKNALLSIEEEPVVIKKKVSFLFYDASNQAVALTYLSAYKLK